MKKQEERCLLYVAMTRARDFLFVSSPYADGEENRGSSLFADVVDCIAQDRFHTVVLRAAPELPRVAEAVERKETPEADNVEERLSEWHGVRKMLAEQESAAAVSVSPAHFVNWTALKTYAECPLRYQHRYLHRIGDALTGGDAGGDTRAGETGEEIEQVRVPKGMTPVEYGNFVHEVLHELMSTRKNGEDPPDEWIETAAKKQGIPAGRIGAVVDNATKIVDAFLSSEFAAPGDGIRLEEPFQVRLDRIVYHGVFDRVERTTDGWVVTDYKVGREHGDYDFQVAFYAWALGRITGADAVVGRLCYLRQSGVVTRPAGGDRAEIGILADQLEKSLTESSFGASPGSHCADCPYSITCLAAAVIR
jgi:ATP-dependent exoDNAse (exonuclease V) beta subunit